MTSLRSLLPGILLVAIAGLAACSPPPPEAPREEHQTLQRAIQEPLDKARSVEAELQKKNEAMQRQIDAEGN